MPKPKAAGCRRVSKRCIDLRLIWQMPRVLRLSVIKKIENCRKRSLRNGELKLKDGGIDIF